MQINYRGKVGCFVISHRGFMDINNGGNGTMVKVDLISVMVKFGVAIRNSKNKILLLFTLTVIFLSGHFFHHSKNSSAFYSAQYLVNYDLLNTQYVYDFNRITFNVSNLIHPAVISDKDNPQLKKLALKALMFWLFKRSLDEDESEEETAVYYSLDIPFFSMVIVLQVMDNAINAAIAENIKQAQDYIYQDSSKKALALRDKNVKKKNSKYDADFEAKWIARENRAAERVMASMARYNELNAKAYQLGEKTFNTLQTIEQTLNTAITQRDAFKAGVESVKIRYQLDVNRRGTELSVNESKVLTGKEKLIEADKHKDDNKLIFLK